MIGTFTKGDSLVHDLRPDHYIMYTSLNTSISMPTETHNELTSSTSFTPAPLFIKDTTTS